MVHDLSGVWSYRIGAPAEHLRRLLQLDPDGTYRKESWWVRNEQAQSSALEVGRWSLSEDGAHYIETIESFNGAPSSEIVKLQIVASSNNSFTLRESKHGTEYQFHRVQHPTSEL